MNNEELEKELKKLNIEFSPEIRDKLDKFYDLLITENKKYNLTRITKKDDVYLKHIYDSLTLIKMVDLSKEYKMLDIGSGAGFPGIVLKIFFPNLVITLLDSNNKKVKFLNIVKEALDLENLNIVHGRAEEYILNKRESFDLVVARAVAPIHVLMELAIPYLKVQGKFIAMKAKENTEELQLGKDTEKYLDCKINSIIKFKLPIENSDRLLIEIIKQKMTNKKFPRRYDQIIKNPLKKKTN